MVLPLRNYLVKAIQFFKLNLTLWFSHSGMAQESFIVFSILIRAGSPA